MFIVLFEVQPGDGLMDTYLGHARDLKPELEGVDGFVDNIRYRSLQRNGWLLSLSSWRNEKAVVRWRTNPLHHDVQEAGRAGVLSDYHLRVGQVIEDTCLPSGQTIEPARPDVTEVGEGPVVTVITGKRPIEFQQTTNPTDCAQVLGLNYYEGSALRSWDIFESLTDNRALLLLLVWRDDQALEEFERHEEMMLPDDYRIRHVRVIRDYGMDDRREAPTYFPAPKRDYDPD